MEDTTTLGILSRLKKASDSTTDIELSKKMGLSKQAIADAKSKDSVPASWIPKSAKLFNVTTDWLFFGRGPMRPNDTPAVQQQATTQPESTASEPCARCAKLEGKLEKVEEQRDSLMEENRNLWKENGELREKCARLEERMDKPFISRSPTEMGNLA